MKIIVILLIVLSFNFGYAKPTELLRRITVFPISADPIHENVAGEAWWSVRSILVKDKRFLLPREVLCNKRMFFSREQI